MADQHRYYDDAQRGGRRDGPDRNEPQSWGHDGGRQQDFSRESGRGDERYAGGPDWQQDRSSGRYGGRSFYGPSESGGRQWGQRDDRGVADFSGGWPEGGRQYGRDVGRPDYGYSGDRSGLGGYGGGRQQFSGDGQLVSQGEAFGRRPAGSGLSYAGRGPRNYQRSDDRIREEICDRMTDDDQLDASEISVQVQKCEVTLTGTVSSREQKRRAEDLAEAISGVREVTNNLRVSRENGASQGTAQSASGHSGQDGQSHGNQAQTGSKTGTKPAGTGGPVS